MKVAVIIKAVGNTDMAEVSKICRAFAEFAEVVTENRALASACGTEYEPVETIFKSCDFVAALGGDGTILTAARKASEFDKPVLGINLGRLGFLSNMEKDTFLKDGCKKLTGDFNTERRMMIEAKVCKEGEPEAFTALNDIVVTRTHIARLEGLKIYVDNEFLGNYLADGVIVSTPTGSTAYSLSAGGPIADPRLEFMIITPICPHMLHARPVIVPPTSTVCIEKPHENRTESTVTADGANGCILRGGEKVIIKKYEKYANFITLSDRSFYDKLRKKLQ